MGKEHKDMFGREIKVGDYVALAGDVKIEGYGENKNWKEGDGEYYKGDGEWIDGLVWGRVTKLLDDDDGTGPGIGYTIIEELVEKFNHGAATGYPPSLKSGVLVINEAMESLKVTKPEYFILDEPV